MGLDFITLIITTIKDKHQKSNPQLKTTLKSPTHSYHQTISNIITNKFQTTRNQGPSETVSQVITATEAR